MKCVRFKSYIFNTFNSEWIALFILELNIHTRKKCMYTFLYNQVFLNLYGKHVIVKTKTTFTCTIKNIMIYTKNNILYIYMHPALHVPVSYTYTLIHDVRPTYMYKEITYLISLHFSLFFQSWGSLL